MKSLKIALLATALAVIPTQSPAQLYGSVTDQFVAAVEKGDAATAIQLLTTRPAMINTRNAKGDTALIVALRNGETDLAGILLQKGADANFQGGNGDTPLIAAAKMGSLRATEWLLEVGAKVNATNRSGETPLIIAVQQRNVQLVRLLLTNGADPDRADSVAGYSAREYAQRDQRSRDIQRLISEAKPKP